MAKNELRQLSDSALLEKLKKTCQRLESVANNPTASASDKERAKAARLAFERALALVKPTDGTQGID